MIRFHSTITKNRFSKMDNKKHSSALKSTLVCLHCDLLVDGSAANLMTKHLTDRPNHICKVIQDKDMKTKDRLQYAMGQPVRVVYLLTSAQTQKVKETNLKLPGSVSPAKSDKAESEPVLPENNQKTCSTKMIVIDGSSEEQTQQPLQPDKSSAGAPVGDSPLYEETSGNTEDLTVVDQLPVSKDEAEDQKNVSE